MERIDFASMDWEPVAAHARQKAHQEQGRRLRVVEFERGFTHPQWCAKGHICYQLDGQMEIEFENRTVVPGPGDALFIPSGDAAKHKPKVLTDRATLLLVEDA